MYFESFSLSMIAEDFASRKSSPMSLMSSRTMFGLPLILAVMEAGVSSWTA